MSSREVSHRPHHSSSSSSAFAIFMPSSPSSAASSSISAAFLFLPLGVFFFADLGVAGSDSPSPLPFLPPPLRAPAAVLILAMRWVMALGVQSVLH